MKSTSPLKSAVVVVVLALLGCETVEQGARDTPPARHAPVPRPATGPTQSVDSAMAQRAELARRARESYRNLSFEEFEATVWREPASLGGKYIVNGDTPILNEKQLREFFENEVMRDPVNRSMQDVNQLIVDAPGGLTNLWNDTMQRQLTYCVSNDFGSRYQTVVDAMEEAALAWESVANIDFIHDPTQDNDCTAANPDIVFDVRPVNVNGQYLARAFFPNEPRAARNVLIDRTAFTTTGNLTLVGILRHELGHSLGFRHEHTRPESGACFEDNDWIVVTEYDPFSVMHYPQCNGAGDWSLTLTSLDENGAACVYGPAPGFTFDPSIPMVSCRDQVSSPCSPKTEVFQGRVAPGEERHFGPFSVTEGTLFEAELTGSGDPDLYTRFDQAPTTRFYHCRPYLTGANETCSLTVPSGEMTAWVMVRGYKDAAFTLTVTHAGSP